MHLRCRGVNRRTYLMNCKRPATQIYYSVGDSEYRPLCNAHARSNWAKMMGFRPLLSTGRITMEQSAKALLRS